MCILTFNFLCRTAGMTGTVLINGEQRSLSASRKLSRYIMQEDVVQKMLTVDEAMKIAADLKLGRNMSDAKKHEAVRYLELKRINPL